MLDATTAEIARNISKTLNKKLFEYIFAKSDRNHDGVVTLREYRRVGAKLIQKNWIEPEQQKKSGEGFCFGFRVLPTLIFSSYDGSVKYFSQFH